MKTFIWVVLLSLGVGIIAFIMWDNHTAAQEGIALAKGRAQTSCLRAVTRGNRICTESSCFLNNRSFFRSCMDNARTTPELCGGVKTTGTLLYFEAWKKKSVMPLIELIGIVITSGIEWLKPVIQKSS